jgi:hypothetical protein
MAVVCLAVALPGGTAAAQVDARPSIAGAAATTRVGRRKALETYGQSNTILTINAWGFNPLDSAGAANFGADDARRTCLVTDCQLLAPLSLPNGALVDAIELEGCDDSATARLGAFFLVAPLNADTAVIPPGGGVETGDASTPGCSTFASNLTPPRAIDNAEETYAVTLVFAGGAGTSARAVRIWYHLQVSPAPATATFSDVPTTHAFFRFIEALAAAGITGGCTPAPNPNFCPDAPLTRGQMAVFLSVALGLHFPN